MASAPSIALETGLLAAAARHREVWVFRENSFSLHGLDRSTARYAVRARSARMPDLDFELVAGYAVREDTGQALREFEGAVGR